jgi:SET domain-containing protein
VLRSAINGRGGFATRRIEAGDYIIEYAGERISQAEGDRRYGEKPYTLLFEVDARIVIDGGVDGNEARFINHSCGPNCEAGGERGKIVIRAMRRIRAGEELTYDYAFTRDDALGAAEDAIYPCRCGARGCRGSILVALEKPKRRRKPPKKKLPTATRRAGPQGSLASGSRRARATKRPGSG